MTLLVRHQQVYDQMFYLNEMQFSAVVKAELSRVLPNFSILDFSPYILGDEGIRRRPDLALVDLNYTMWVVVEVELEHHSLRHHVEPQIRTFVTGRYDQDHAQLLCERDNSLDFESLRNLIFYFPPIVSVVVNSRAVLNSGWASLETDYSAHLTFLETFKARNGDVIFSITGYLPTPRPKQIIRTKKHVMMNALVCNFPNDVPATVRDNVEICFENRIYEWPVLRTADSVIFLPPAGIDLRTDRNYEIRLVDEDTFFLHLL